VRESESKVARVLAVIHPSIERGLENSQISLSLWSLTSNNNGDDGSSNSYHRRKEDSRCQSRLLQPSLSHSLRRTPPRSYESVFLFTFSILILHDYHYLYYSTISISFYFSVSLKPELFEGMRFDFTKMLNQKFSLNHRYLPFLFFSFVSLFFIFSSSILCLYVYLFIYCCYLISVSMGPIEIPSQSAEVIKIPTSNYEFGATFIDHPRV
jgi:hypothetical protein